MKIIEKIDRYLYEKKMPPTREDVYSMAKDYMEANGFRRSSRDIDKIRKMYSDVQWTKSAVDQLNRELDFLKRAG